jgi:hypothetical protein
VDGIFDGKWEGDTLVVQTTGFKEEGWLDNAGHPRGQSMLITERFHRRDFGHIELEIRYEDPTYYRAGLDVIRAHQLAIFRGRRKNVKRLLVRLVGIGSTVPQCPVHGFPVGDNC